MSSFCQPLPRPVIEEMLQLVARAVCDRPGETPAQGESRTRQMVLTTLGFDPRDGLEYMLATIAFGHFHMILDSMHDVFHGQLDTMKAKTKTTIVALNRALLESVKEYRYARKRPMGRSAAETRAAGAEPPRAAASAPDLAVPPPAPAETVRAAQADVSGSASVATPVERRKDDVLASRTAAALRALAAAGHVGIETEAVPPAGLAPPPASDRGPDSTGPRQAGQGPRPAGQRGPEGADGQAPANGDGEFDWTEPEDDGGTIEEHIAGFQAALKAAEEAIAEAAEYASRKKVVATGD